MSIERLSRVSSHIIPTLLVAVFLFGCANPFDSSGGSSGGDSPTESVSRFSVTYHANGAGGDVPTDTNNYEEGTAVTVLGNTGDLAKAGHSFVGWNTQADGEGTSHQPDDTFNMGTEEVTLYAQWSTGDYELNFDANGGSGTMDPLLLTYGEASNIPGNTFSRTGYDFAGWNTDSDGSGDAYADESSFTMNAEGVTLYAQWNINADGVKDIIEGVIDETDQFVVIPDSWPSASDYYYQGECWGVLSFDHEEIIETAGTITVRVRTFYRNGSAYEGGRVEVRSQSDNTELNSFDIRAWNPGSPHYDRLEEVGDSYTEIEFDIPNEPFEIRLQGDPAVGHGDREWGLLDLEVDLD